VVRFRIWLAAALAVGAIITGLLRAQVTEEQQNRGDKSDTSESRAASSPNQRKLRAPLQTSNRQVSEEREKIRQNRRDNAIGHAAETPEPTTSPKSKRGTHRHRDRKRPRRNRMRKRPQKKPKNWQIRIGTKRRGNTEPGKTPAHPPEAERTAD